MGVAGDCTIGQNRKKHRINSHRIIQFPTSEGVSEVSEHSRGRKQSEQGRASSTSEWCERTNERMSEWPSTAVWILGYSGPQWMGGTVDGAG